MTEEVSLEIRKNPRPHKYRTKNALKKTACIPNPEIPTTMRNLCTGWTLA